MSRIIVLLAGGVCLSACSYLPSMPSLDMPSFGAAGGATQVHVESEPPGAEARAGVGPGCRTPCMLTIPDSGLSSVTISLPGYVPQSVPVRVTRAQQAESLSESGAAQSLIAVEPNPVFAQLEPAPPPPPPPKKRAPPKRKPQPAAAPPQAQPAPQQPRPGFGPPPQQQPGFGPPPQQQPGFGPPPQQQPGFGPPPR